MFGPIIAAVARLRRVAARREGNIAILFGLSAIPLVVGGGIAIDAARGYTVKTQLTAALDAAALAVGSSPGTMTAAQMQTRMLNYFNANFVSSAIPSQNLSVTMTDPTQPSFTVTATVQVPTAFMELVGINTMQVSASNQITKGSNALELALVLDNTGSMMCGDGSGCSTPAHITALTSNAQTAVDTLFQDSVDPTKLKIAIVPYVTSVNVGGAFCVGSRNCSNIATDCSGDFMTDNGNALYNPITAVSQPTITTTVTLTGNVANNSNLITTISAANVTSGSSTNTNLSPGTAFLLPGMSVSGSKIPANTKITKVTPTSVTMNNNASGTVTGDSLTFTISTNGVRGMATNGSTVVTNIVPPVISGNNNSLAASEVVVGTGIGVPNPNGNIHYAPATSVSATSTTANTVTLCQNATQGDGATQVVQLTLYAPMSYDMTNTPTTQNWKGCVVEPTQAGEDATGVGPDISEPNGGWTAATMGSNWWAFVWANGTSGNFTGGDNTWYLPGSNQEAIQYLQIAGNASGATMSSYGPNLSCPQPMVRLTNTQSTLDTALQNMRAWDNSGTAITVGMIWGWRALSPNPPFSDGQPYNTASLIKAVVLETDGDAEVAGDTQGDTTDFTGYGYVSEGKLGSTTAGQYLPYGTPAVGTANYYLGTRLTQVCNNMKTAGIVIYTIGLGDGATNQALSGCAGPPGVGKFFAAPTAADLQTAFQQIANSLNALRLSK